MIAPSTAYLPGKRKPEDHDSPTCPLRKHKRFCASVVAGGAALVRQYFEDGYYPDGRLDSDGGGFVPMGSLIKAIFINSGEWVAGSEAKRQVSLNDD